MKKCPVCGVMMGDNVARCSMCKYDFQKASLGDAEQAIAEAANNLKAKEAENAARVAEKRTEEEKHLLETKQRIERDIATLSEQYDREKGKLEAEFQEMQKVAISEKERIDKELGEAQNELEETRRYALKAKQDADEEAQTKRASAQKDYDEMIDLAKKEQQRIIAEAQQETENWAVQVEQELAEAMKKRDEMLAEAKDLQDFVDNADQVKADKDKEVNDYLLAKDKEMQDFVSEKDTELNSYLASIEQLKADKQKEIEDADAELIRIQQFYESEKTRLEEEAKKISMEQANEALRLKEEADAERRAINEEKEAIIADIEQRRADAQVELDQLVEQAKNVIAEAEEATKTRDAMNKSIEEAKAIEAKRDEMEKQIAEYEASMEEALSQRDSILKEWDDKIVSVKDDYEKAEKTIAEAKVMEEQAEAIGQEIIFNAEKQAVALKTLALNESEKGQMSKLLEEKEQQIEEMTKERDELLKEIESMKASIEDLKTKVGSGAIGGSAVIQDGPKDYSVEVVSHNESGEVDYEAISVTLAKKSRDGWKLVSVINDEGGKLQSSLGNNEAASLSTGVYSSKEDRVVLIFERARKA